MATVIYNQRGFSGALVEIIEEDIKYTVKKTGDISRNVTQLRLLRGTGIPIPDIIYSDESTLIMEYIPGLPIETFISYYGVHDLFKDIVEYITYFQKETVDFDYTDVYNEFLYEIDYTQLPFTSSELTDRLPKILPRSKYYHGDFTLGNMIHNGYRWQTFLIDPVSTVFDSWVFDIAKLRQDTEGLWFSRDYLNLPDYVNLIKSMTAELDGLLRIEYPLAYDDNLYILMLLRVYRHCKTNTMEHNLIRNEILRLWK
jgi:tRNA A-37 threonylcarbamoyl transferase component Bud32